MASVGELTLLLRQAEAGRAGALDELAALVHADLERMAHSYLRKQFGDRARSITLDTSALVNESFIKLIRQRAKYDNRGHFFAIATRMMLRVLIDYRRRRGAAKRGGADTHITLVLDEHQIEGRAPAPAPAPGQDLIEVEHLATALNKLETRSRRKADVVRMRVIWGLDLGQIAESLDVSPSTVDRDWRFSKAWLAEEVGLADR